MKKFILLVPVFLVLIGCSNPVDKAPNKDHSQHQDEAFPPDSQQTQEDTTISPNKENLEEPVAQGNTLSEKINGGSTMDPLYLHYNKSVVDALIANKKQFAIYFHADWCPKCRALDKDLEAKIASFPRGTFILKADFDTETELRKNLGVSEQTSAALYLSDASSSVINGVTVDDLLKFFKG